MSCVMRGITGLVVALALACVAPLMAAEVDDYRGQKPKRQTLVIQGGTLFDGTGAEPRPNHAIVVTDVLIAHVGERIAVPDGATVIDAKGLAILPGLIDLHVHFGAPSAESKGLSGPETMRDYVRQRPKVRRSLHRAGVTTIRSVGDVLFSILELKRQIRERELAGPRVYTAGPMFTAPKGHPISTIFKGNPFLIATATRQVRQVERARAEVRKLASAGVDGVKIIYEGDGGLPRLPFDVMQAIADEAHKQGLWVAVHTSKAQEVRDALRAGADTIEHGVTSGNLDDETIALLRKRDVTYIPTLAVLDSLSNGAATKRPSKNVKAALEGGVRIGAGTDCQGLTMSFGRSLHRELELLVAAGLTPAQALLAATRDAAVALKVEKVLGTVEPGKWADLVLVAGRPWERISDTQHVRVVVQGGCVVVDQRESENAP